MKVFSVKAYGAYSAGYAVVAALSAAQVDIIVHNCSSGWYNIQWWNKPEIKELPLTADVEYPQIIDIVEWWE